MQKHRIYPFVCLGLILAAVMGCAGIVKLQPEERGAQASLIQELSAKWESCTIYAAIWPGDKPVALLFDLRSDERIILADGWSRVDTSMELASLAQWMRAGQTPRLFQVLGPDGHLFGYVYTAVPDLRTQVVDARTVRFYRIEPPRAPGV